MNKNFIFSYTKTNSPLFRFADEIMKFSSFALFLVQLFFARNVLAINCITCISPDTQYGAAVRRQFATQTDVFLRPHGVTTPNCSKELNLDRLDQMDAQICAKDSMCVTLFPNLPNTTFAARGCFEQLLRYNLRGYAELRSQGCYMVQSLPAFQNNIPIDYVICTCNGNYCNTMPIPSTVPKPYSFGTSKILQVSSIYPEGPLQIISSSVSRFIYLSATVILFIISIYL
ncbi:unnamed protein product [Caenorhabditis angaria]|uniref:Uncharacterized protein n=1 Tax=Caenorhabditis angaria TaxID=860376 RepID=A0A9P1N6H1_9PELO|nr:unnamed protein product [Caenorhabditis angaria]